MSSLRRERRRARESALALLYSGDITETSASSLVESGAYPDDSITLSDYAESLVSGVVAHQAEIDAHLSSTSENWALDRMPVVDRAILRLAVYEMLYVDEVPVSVAINEAVDLAKFYGGEDDSSRFVNGVLGRIARKEQLAVEEGAPAADQAKPSQPGLDGAGPASAEAEPTEPGLAKPEQLEPTLPQTEAASEPDAESEPEPEPELEPEPERDGEQ